MLDRDLLRRIKALAEERTALQRSAGAPLVPKDRQRLHLVERELDVAYQTLRERRAGRRIVT